MTNKIYLPGLHGIRFFAALCVIIGHIEVFRFYYSLPSLGIITKGFSELGVDIFFTLSGFLITFLLLKENEIKQKISIKNFYIRRILRIWPLYFLIFFIGIFIFPLFTGYNFNHKISISLLYIFFLPHLAKVLFTMNYIIVILWSIGVEENFYLFFPWFFRANNQRFIKAILIFLFSFLFLKFIITYAAFQDIPFKQLYKFFSDFFNHVLFENMFIGSLAAFLYFNKFKIIKKLQYSWITTISIVLLLFFIVIPFGEITNYIGLDPIFAFIGTSSLYAILTVCVILKAIEKNKLSLFLELKIFRYLGKISYGLYVFHPLVLCLLYMLPKKIYGFNWFIQYLIVVFFTILLSSISYKYYESWFLKQKNMFSAIISDDNSK